MKKRILSILMCLFVIVTFIPITATANDGESEREIAQCNYRDVVSASLPEKGAPLVGATIIYVSNSGGSGNGDTEKNPTTLEEAIERINEATSDTGEALRFVISLTEDIERNGNMDLNLTNNITTLLGNGHMIRTSEGILVQNGAVLHLGKEDGTDTLTLKELIRAQAHTTVSAGNGISAGTVHMYDGVSIIGADDAFENDSSGHGVGINEGTFYMHGGEINGFCIPQPGAGVIINNGKFYMYGGKITNCEAKGGTQFGGGAIWADGVSEIHIFGGELSNNRADNRGGAIAMQNNAEIEIKGDVKITGNKASRGGAISIQNNATLTIGNGVLFQNNTCQGNGGAISALSGCKVTISGAQFNGNRSETGYGGAIYHQRASGEENKPLTLKNVTFNGNTAAYGGAVLSLGGAGEHNFMTALISDCIFTDNRAHCFEEKNEEGSPVKDGGFGGALYVQDTKLTLSNCAISKNEAEDSGGGVYFTGTHPELLALNIKEAIEIWENTAPKASNLYLLNLTPPENPEEGDLTEEFQTTLTVSGSLITEAGQTVIGIYMDKPGVFTNGYSQSCGEAQPSTYFRSDHSDYHVEWAEGKSEATLAAGATEYTIVATAGENGRVDPLGSVKVQTGTDKTFHIIPNTGYHIADVLVDGKSIGVVDSYTFRAVSNGHTIAAFFEEDGSGGSTGTTRYTIEASAGHGGGISPDGRVRVSRGSDKTFRITPDAGYEIADVLVDGESVGAVSRYTFETVRKNHTIEAEFRAVEKAPDTGVDRWLNTTDHMAYLNGYGTGLFGPDDHMTRAEAAQMFYNLLLDQEVSAAVRFTDVPADAWYARAVEALASLGMVEGVGGGKFAPERTITRAEFTVMAMRFARLPEGGENPFSDVTSSDWFYDQVVGAVQYGWITGYTDGTFRPEATITRAEVTAITNRLLDRAADEDYVDDHAGELRQFPDVSASYWAYHDIVEATNAHSYRVYDGEEHWM